MGAIDIAHLDLLSKPILNVLAASLLPLAAVLFNSGKLRKPRVGTTRVRPLLMRVDAEILVSLGPGGAVALFKEIANGTLFPDRELYLVVEEELYLEYYADSRERLLLAGKGYLPARIKGIMTVEFAATGSGTRIAMSSRCRNPVTAFSNAQNMEHVRLIADALAERGVVVESA